MIQFRILCFVIISTVVSKAFFVLAQDKVFIVRECGRDAPTTELYPGRYTATTLIRNYNFTAGRYRNGEDCQIQFWTDQRPLVLTIKFNLFEVETEAKCRMDYLCINGVNFCGSWEVNKTYSYKVPAHRSFTMRFVTDSSVTRRGFEISVEATVADTPGNFPEVSQGYGSAEGLLIRSMFSKNAYRDRCLPENHDLPHGSPVLPSKSYTTTAEESDTTRSDDQTDVLSYITTPNLHQTNNPSYGINPKPLQTDKAGYATTRDPLQTDDLNYATARNPLQTDDPDYATARNPLQTDDPNYATARNPLQTDDSNYATARNPLQTDDPNYATTRDPLQTDNPNYATARNPLQTDDPNYATARNPLQTDDPNHVTARNPLQTDNPNYATAGDPLQTDEPNHATAGDPLQTDDPNHVTARNPLQTDDPNYATARNPLQTDEPTQATARNPLQTDDPNHVTARNPLQTDNPNYATAGDPLQTDEPNHATAGDPLQTDDPNHVTARNPLQTDDPNYATARNPLLTDDPTYDNTPNPRDNDNPNYDTTPTPLQENDTSYNTSPNPHRIDSPKYNNTHNPHETDYPENETTPSQHKGVYPLNNTTSDPLQTDDSAIPNPHSVLNTRSAPSGTQPPVIYCSPDTQPIHVTSAGLTYIVRNAGFGTRPYLNNEKCSVEFRTSPTALQFAVRFTSFNLEGSQFCDYDSLCVGGVKFCGSWETGHAYGYLVPAYETFTLAFTTDVSNTGTGFEVRVDVQEARGRIESYEASAGTGSSLGGIVYQLLKIDNYFDKCSFKTVVRPVTDNYNITASHYGPTHNNSVTTGYGNRVTDRDQITDNNFQTTDKGYKTTDNGFQTTDKGYKTTDNGFQTTDKGYKTTDNGYQITDNGYKTTDKGYKTTDKGYMATDNGYQKTDYKKPYNELQTTNSGYQTTNPGDQATNPGDQTTNPGDQTTNSGYQTTNPGDQTTNPGDQTTNPGDQTTNPDDQRTDSDDEAMDPDYQTTNKMSGTSDNHSAPTRTHVVRSPVIYCGDHNTTVNASNGKSSYVVRSGRHGYGSGYTSGERCVVVFGVANVSRMLELTFKTFDIEYHQDCCYDFLCVKGVRFCGDWAAGYSFRFVVPAHNTFTLEFATDESKTGSGFEVEVAISDPPADKDIAEVFSGVGSREARLTYKVSNLSDYMDNCQHPARCTSGHPSATSTDTHPYTSTREASTTWEASSTVSSFLTQNLHVIQRMIETAQDRLSYAYDLLTSLV